MSFWLRDQLQLETNDDGSSGRLVDPLFARTVTLGPRRRDPDQLIGELEAAGFVRAKVEDSVRCLTLLHLIDGIGDGVCERVRAIWAGEVALEHHALPGARFACQGSGMCCRS